MTTQGKVPPTKCLQSIALLPVHCPELSQSTHHMQEQLSWRAEVDSRVNCIKLQSTQVSLEASNDVAATKHQLSFEAQ